MPKPKQPLVVRRTLDGRWYNVIIGNNGEVLNTSEVFNDSKAPIKNFNAVAGVFLQNHPKVEDLTATITDWFHSLTEEKGGTYADLAQYILDKHHSVQDNLYTFIKREKTTQAMTAQELRIGNWVLNFLGEPIQVNTLPFSPMFPMPTPIPLDQQWLEKLGFRFQPDWCLWYLDVNIHYSYATHDGLLPNETNFKLLAEDDGIYLLRIEGISWGQPIRYVHQLMNLFYAITGQELTLSQ